MNFGSGAGAGDAAGSAKVAEEFGVANVVENPGVTEPGDEVAIKVFVFAASTSVTLAAEVDAKSTRALLLVSCPAAALPCAFAAHTLPSPRKTNTSSLFMMLPSEG